jgi:hypothetical protein
MPKNSRTFYLKICTKLTKIWVWDPGSEIRDPESGKKPIPDPGSWSRGQKGTRSRIRNTDGNVDPDSRRQQNFRLQSGPEPQHCNFREILTSSAHTQLNQWIRRYYQGYGSPLQAETFDNPITFSKKIQWSKF